MSGRAGRTRQPTTIARFPTTNAMFKRFLDVGGYDDASFWPGPSPSTMKNGVLRDFLGEARQASLVE